MKMVQTFFVCKFRRINVGYSDHVGVISRKLLQVSSEYISGAKCKGDLANLILVQIVSIVKSILYITLHYIV